jgi:hypothetical protein
MTWLRMIYGLLYPGAAQGKFLLKMIIFTDIPSVSHI